MIKRKWYERVSAAALAAMLFMNSGGMGVQSRAEILSGENGVVIQEAEGEAQPEANEEEQGLQEEKLENNGENGENDPEEENPEEESAQEEPSRGRIFRRDGKWGIIRRREPYRGISSR